MAHCDEYVELISASLDGALSPAERERLEEHLASCPECRALYEDLTALHTALGELPPVGVKVPADLTERILAAVAAEQVLPLEKKTSSVRWQRWLASAAVLAVVVAGAWGWKPWEHDAAGEQRPESAPAAMMQSTTTNSGEELSQDNQTAESVLLYTADSETPDGKAEPAAPDLPTGGKVAAAKIAGAVQDTALPSYNDSDAPAEAPEESGEMSLRMSRMTPEPEMGLGDGGESVLPTEAPQEVEEAAETDPEETLPIQSLMTMMTTGLPTGDTGAEAILNAEEAATEALLTAGEALDRLLEEYPLPGCETWEYGDIEPGWRSPVWMAEDDCACWLQYNGLPYGMAHEFTSYAEEGDELVPLGGFSVPLDGGEITSSGA